MFNETEMDVFHDEVHKISNGILCSLSNYLRPTYVINVISETQNIFDKASKI
jgi:hypothetical protein